jgi:hypothetical protein
VVIALVVTPEAFPIAYEVLAVRCDNPQSQITPANTTLSNWPGFRIDVIFQPGPIDHRLNLVEGDTSFAFFVEADASLMGTVFDGTNFYPVKSAPGTIVPGTLYRAQFSYMPSSTLLLTLNGGTLTVQGSNGAAVRPVQANGIKVGCWPGGDSRYTFFRSHGADEYLHARTLFGRRDWPRKTGLQ